MVEVYPIGSKGILKMSMMKSDEELCERKANIDGMDQGWNLIKVKYVGITLWVAAAVSIQFTHWSLQCLHHKTTKANE